MFFQRNEIEMMLIALSLVAGCGDDAGGNESSDSTSDEGGPEGSSTRGDSVSDTSASSDGTDATAESGTDTATTAPESTGPDGSSSSDTGQELPPPSEDWARDILATDLQLDLTALTGTATITIAGSQDSTGASFEIGDLAITSVDADVGALAFEVSGTQLDVGIPTSDEPFVLVVEYGFSAHDNFDGWMAGSGVSFLWPYFCGNLFPCKSTTDDGVQFRVDVTGAPDGLTVITTPSLPTDAPSYMPAIAVGDYTEIELEPTTAGTTLSVWAFTGQEGDAILGTEHLSGVFDYYEATYGPYPFGTHVGSVAADWGPSAYGGMEHHPFWHVARDAMADPVVHAHEAAHGWFGNGVRLECWEDFVLSEGLATYLAARGLAAADPDRDVWGEYECSLQFTCDSATYNTQLVLDTCNEIDIFSHPLWGPAPYYKGAFFLREVANVIGEEELDTILADFFQANVGETARTVDLVAEIAAAGGPEIDALADTWLYQVECPIDTSTLCAE